MKLQAINENKPVPLWRQITNVRETIDDTNLMQLQCIASTGKDYCGVTDSQEEKQDREPEQAPDCANATQPNPIFQSAEFSPDSSTIVTYTEDQTLRTFLLPADLLDDDSHEHHLTPCSFFRSPSRVQSYCIYPGFNQFDSTTTLLLQASSDVPIALRNVFSPEPAVAKYNLIHPTTETYLKANSILFTPDGRHFVAGSTDLLTIFDSSRNGSGPIVKHNKTGSNSFRGSIQTRLATSGIVSALDCSPDGLLATGTFNRTIGLFSNYGQGECVSAWSLGNVDADHGRTGSGVTKVQWSPDGQYLFVGERQSDVIQVFDIRNTGKHVGWLSGRKARTTQKLGFGVVSGLCGLEVWAGGMDGRVRMWTDVGCKEGEHMPDDEFRCHDDVVASATWDPSGTVLATCSGSREGKRDERFAASGDTSNSIIEDQGDDNSCRGPDHSLKLWITTSHSGG